jgi:universal stress protein A
MNMKRILCPIDYSTYSKAANEYASMLAKSTGAQIIFLHVFIPDVPYGASPAMVNMALEEQKELERLEKITPTEKEVVATHVVEVGAAADRIVAFANANDVDLIVMGTHGRTGVKRVLMGSVAESVVRNADCPVLAIKANSKISQAS